ncbi:MULTISPECIES: hypothetical protein [Cyanophyceae]|nr:hypothetical protein [Trichocoleus sp. FACHB-40]
MRRLRERCTHSLSLSARSHDCVSLMEKSDRILSGCQRDRMIV